MNDMEEDRGVLSDVGDSSLTVSASETNLRFVERYQRYCSGSGAWPPKLIVVGGQATIVYHVQRGHDVTVGYHSTW
jgi:hypothetical protein